MAQPDDRLNGGGARRQHHRARRRAQMDERVRFVREQIRRIVEKGAGTGGTGELSDKTRIHERSIAIVAGHWSAAATDYPSTSNASISPVRPPMANLPSDVTEKDELRAARVVSEITI